MASENTGDLLGRTTAPGAPSEDERGELLGATVMADPTGTSVPQSADKDVGRLAEGTVLGNRYELRRILGRGGMGAVWEAADLELGRSVALKFLSSTELLARPDAVRAFKNEVAHAQQLTHPRIIRVYDLHDMDGYVFFSMERIDGSSLQELIRAAQVANRSIYPAVAARIVEGLLTALDHAHECGVVHLDVKPSNIMLIGHPAGSGPPLTAPPVKLLDFGISRAVHRASALPGAGTPEYMAPETARGAEGDARSDLYSVGVILYELLMLERPRGRYPRIAARRSDCPAHVDHVIDRVLQPDPNRRYTSARELLAELQPDRFPGPPPSMIPGEDLDGTRTRLPATVPQRTLERFQPGSGSRRLGAGTRSADPLLGDIATNLKKDG